jgi:hypothetical protein
MPDDTADSAEPTTPAPVTQDDLSRDLADFELAHQARLDAGATADAAGSALAAAKAAREQALADLDAANAAELAAKAKLFADADAYSAE